jgi:predicted RNase H-like nuclease
MPDHRLPDVLVAGVDAWRKGWVIVLVRNGEVVATRCASTFAQARDLAVGAAVVAVDMPIGLPVTGVRAADVEARAAVGPRRSSVFPAPPRAALVCGDVGAARRIHPSLSSQAWALGPRILEVEALLDDRVFEVHPEVSFAALAGGHLAYPKRTWNGQMERRRLLAAAGLELPDELAGPAGGVPVDDVLDATAAAWSASRIAGGAAASLPAEPPLTNGRPVAIWF